MREADTVLSGSARMIDAAREIANDDISMGLSQLLLGFTTLAAAMGISNAEAHQMLDVMYAAAEAALRRNPQ